MPRFRQFWVWRCARLNFKSLDIKDYENLQNNASHGEHSGNDSPSFRHKEANSNDVPLDCFNHDASSLLVVNRYVVWYYGRDRNDPFNHNRIYSDLGISTDFVVSPTNKRLVKYSPERMVQKEWWFIVIPHKLSLVIRQICVTSSYHYSLTLSTMGWCARHTDMGARRLDYEQLIDESHFIEPTGEFRLGR